MNASLSITTISSYTQGGEFFKNPRLGDHHRTRHEGQVGTSCEPVCILNARPRKWKRLKKSHGTILREMSGRANNERELACPRRAGKDLGGSGWPPETFWLVLVSSLLRGCGFTPELGNLKGIICRSELFPGGSEVKASACYAEDLASIPGSGRSPGEGNGNPLQCSCLENPRDGGAWWAAVCGIAQSWTRLKRLSSSSSRL